MGRRGESFQEEGREWRLPVLLYSDDLWTKGLRQMFSDDSTIWREWRITGLLRGFMQGIDTVKDCLMKRGLDVRQARRMIGVYGGGL